MRTPMIVLAILLAAAAPAVAKGDGPLRVDHEALDGGRFAIYVSNDLPGPLTVDLALELDNMVASDYAPTLVVGGKQRVLAAHVAPAGRGRTHFRYKSHYQLGDFRARPDGTVYRIPYAAGTTQKLGQGYFGSFSHQKDHSLDFRMPEGTAIAAARGGVVVKTVDEFEGHGQSDYYKKRANAIYVAHDDGTVGMYLHLRRGGVAVRVGQRVEAGDVIGYSGNTGFSTMPHLHFDVRVPTDGHTNHTIPTRFRLREAPNGTSLTPETRYTAY